MKSTIENYKDSFYMHVKVIGLNMEKFYDLLKSSFSLKNIIKYWDIDLLKKKNITKQINTYFDELLNEMEEENYIEDNIRESVIIKVNNLNDPEVNLIIEKINKFYKKLYMPLLLFLTIEDTGNKLNYDKEKYAQIDPRLIFVTNYTENGTIFEKEIAPLLLRFCSIHNELGDEFSIKEGINEESFDLTEEYYPINLNIISMGRVGVGKSTGINEILQEYKTKEIDKGFSLPKKIAIYQVNSLPIKILSLPGIESENNAQSLIEKLKSYKIKNKIHIILYFLNFEDKRFFNELEYPIIEEISLYKSTKILYVITHSPKNLEESDKIKVFDRINTRIQEITKNKLLSDKIKMFKATKNNAVFVDFNGDKNKSFGKKELFNKIYDIIIKSKDYKITIKEFNEENIIERASKLKAKAESSLLFNKIVGGIATFASIASFNPLFSYFSTKYIINPNAANKKLEELFGFKLELINKEDKRNRKKKNRPSINIPDEVKNKLNLNYVNKISFFLLNRLNPLYNFSIDPINYYNVLIYEFVNLYLKNNYKIKNSFKNIEEYFSI